MSNNQMMGVVAVVLVLIVAMLVYDRTREPQTPGEAISQMVDDAKDNASEAKEEIKDEIDDHTTSR